MPSTIVKLSSSDARAWAHNQPVWLDERGEVARSVSREEQAVIGSALQKSLHIDQSFRQVLPLLPLVAPSRRSHHRVGHRPLVQASTPTIELAFHVEFFGQKRVVSVYTGRLRYAIGREVLAARLLADHGECVLHGRNGKCIAVLRDPLIAERAPNVGRRVQWSKGMDPVLPGVSPMQRRASRATRTSVTLAPLFSPDQCPNDCRGRRGSGAWALATGAKPPTDREHHPVCKYAKAWAQTLEESNVQSVLYDLELGRVARTAEPDEVAEADAAERRTGIRQVTVEGRLYAVLSAEEAAIAAREARGEGDESALTTGATAPSALTEALTPGSAPSEPEVTPTTDAERSEWPLLPPTGSDNYRERAEITARDYLSRPTARGAEAQ